MGEREVTRRKYIPKEKVRIVLEVSRAEVEMDDPRGWEDIRPDRGGPGRIRTRDSRIKSPELFR